MLSMQSLFPKKLSRKKSGTLHNAEELHCSLPKTDEMSGMSIHEVPEEQHEARAGADDRYEEEKVQEASE